MTWPHRCDWDSVSYSYDQDSYSYAKTGAHTWWVGDLTAGRGQARLCTRSMHTATFRHLGEPLCLTWCQAPWLSWQWGPTSCPVSGRSSGPKALARLRKSIWCKNDCSMHKGRIVAASRDVKLRLTRIRSGCAIHHPTNEASTLARRQPDTSEHERDTAHTTLITSAQKYL